MAEWAGVVSTTTRDFIKGEEVAILRNRKLLALLKEKGRITMNHEGTEVQWQVRYKHSPLSGYDDMDTVSFSRLNRWKNAVLPWRGYSATDVMSQKEILMNKGAAALVRRYSTLAKNLMQDIEEQIGTELYVDGNATGNSKRWHGIESFMGNSGAASGGFIATPSDTYAGLSTALAGYGGSWSGNWPDGTGDVHYDFWSPLIVDYTDTAWSASTKTWPNTCLEALRYGILMAQKNKSTNRNKMDVILVTSNMYRQFLDKLQQEENLHVTSKDGNSGLYELGFRDIQNFDGVDITWEYGVPSGVGYGWVMDDLELKSLSDQLFYSKGPDYNLADQTYRFFVGTFSNLSFGQTRHFLKFAAVT